MKLNNSFLYAGTLAASTLVAGQSLANGQPSADLCQKANDGTVCVLKDPAQALELGRKAYEDFQIIINTQDQTTRIQITSILKDLGLEDKIQDPKKCRVWAEAEGVGPLAVHFEGPVACLGATDAQGGGDTNIILGDNNDFATRGAVAARFGDTPVRLEKSGVSAPVPAAPNASGKITIPQEQLRKLCAKFPDNGKEVPQCSGKTDGNTTLSPEARIRGDGVSVDQTIAQTNQCLTDLGKMKQTADDEVKKLTVLQGKFDNCEIGKSAAEDARKAAEKALDELKNRSELEKALDAWKAVLAGLLAGGLAGTGGTYAVMKSSRNRERQRELTGLRSKNPTLTPPDPLAMTPDERLFFELDKKVNNNTRLTATEVALFSALSESDLQRILQQGRDRYGISPKGKLRKDMIAAAKETDPVRKSAKWTLLIT